MIYRLVLGLFLMACWVPAAWSHDIWISQEGKKNKAGEWCCGEGDCGTLSQESVRLTSNGYEINGFVEYSIPRYENGASTHVKSVESVREFVPYSEMQPSPDGLFWRCKRPDGSRRCFFGPPPGS